MKLAIQYIGNEDWHQKQFESDVRTLIEELPSIFDRKYEGGPTYFEAHGQKCSQLWKKKADCLYILLDKFTPSEAFSEMLVMAYKKEALQFIAVLQGGGVKLEKPDFKAVAEYMQNGIHLKKVKEAWKMYQDDHPVDTPSTHAKILHQHAQTLARIGADLQKLLK